MTALTRRVPTDRISVRSLSTSHARTRSAGELAAIAWLSACGLVPPSMGALWEVAISLDVIDERASTKFADTIDTRFHIAIASTEWGLYFCHHSRASWIRVTDLPFVHERDDYLLLPHVPPLRDLGRLVRSLETRYRIRFRRQHAAIRSTLPNAEDNIRRWVGTAI